MIDLIIRLIPHAGWLAKLALKDSKSNEAISNKSQPSTADSHVSNVWPQVSWMRVQLATTVAASLAYDGTLKRGSVLLQAWSKLGCHCHAERIAGTVNWLLCRP